MHERQKKNFFSLIGRRYRHFPKEEKWMANRPVEKCSISCVIRVMQIKTGMKHNYIPIRTAKIKI